MAQKQRQKRSDTWQRIKDEAPDVAAFLTGVSAVFGKPAGVRVEIDGETVVDTLTTVERAREREIEQNRRSGRQPR